VSDAIAVASVLAGAYLLGSVPFGYLVVRVWKKTDIRTHGSGNIGATNVFRIFGPIPAAVVFVLDAAKGAVPAALARTVHCAVPGLLPVAAGLSAVAGHTWPVFLRGSGGKGVATAFGMIAALSPRAAASAFGVWAVLFAATRYVSVGSIGAAVALPLLLFVFERNAVLVCFGILVCVLIVRRHASNIARLAAGTENRFRFPWTR